jgi:superfamily II DNA/RNA helicase
MDLAQSLNLLTRLIDLHDLKLGIVFCNTKRMVDDLTDELVARGYSADRIHGDTSQAQRDRVMTKFRGGGLEFLVEMRLSDTGLPRFGRVRRKGNELFPTKRCRRKTYGRISSLIEPKKLILPSHGSGRDLS